jgi:hypothetical protein
MRSVHNNVAAVLLPLLCWLNQTPVELILEYLADFLVLVHGALILLQALSVLVEIGKLENTAVARWALEPSKLRLLLRVIQLSHVSVLGEVRRVQKPALL